MIKELPEFVDREKEKKELLTILSGRPSLVYFVYGPINSGKTVLLTRVFEELPENYRVFYINFRRVELSKYEDFVRTLFVPREEGFLRRVLKGLRGIKELDIGMVALEYGEKILNKINFSFEIPVSLMRLFFSVKEKERDCFKYLEELFRRLREKGLVPVLVFDEIQMVKEIRKNGPVIHDVFNFMVSMTKETHLCHCLCATSDCLFIEEIYNSARLEGRARYLLVDDLDRARAYEVYEEFGFEDKDLVWEYVGGKFGDMVILFEEKRRGYSEREAIFGMLKNESFRLEWLGARLFKKEEKAQEIWDYLKKFKDKYERKISVRDEIDKAIFWIRENILFYNPVEGTLRPQGRLIWHVIKKML